MQESLLKYGKETLAHKNDEIKWKEVKLPDIIKHTMLKGECTFIILGKTQLLVSYIQKSGHTSNNLILMLNSYL